MRTLRYKVEYEDPQTGEVQALTKCFSDTPAETDPATEFIIGPVSAEEWAIDYAYALADKGWFQLTSIGVEA